MCDSRRNDSKDGDDFEKMEERGAKTEGGRQTYGVMKRGRDDRKGGGPGGKQGTRK